MYFKHTELLFKYVEMK